MIHVTDRDRASKALNLLMAGHGVALAMATGSLLLALAPSNDWTMSFDSMRTLAWIGIDVVVTLGFVLLATTLVDRQLVVPLAVVSVFDLLLDVASMAVQYVAVTPAPSAGLLTFTAIAARVLTVWLLVRLLRGVKPWLSTALVIAGAVAIGRALASQLFPQEVWLQVRFSPGFAWFSLISGVVQSTLLLLAFFTVRASLDHAPDVSSPSAGVAPPPAGSPTTTNDVTSGALLLAAGVLITLWSYSSAAGGGRYLIATGAIGVGLGRIIRGLVRGSQKRSGEQ